MTFPLHLDTSFTGKSFVRQAIDKVDRSRGYQHGYDRRPARSMASDAYLDGYYAGRRKRFYQQATMALVVTAGMLFTAFVVLDTLRPVVDLLR